MPVRPALLALALVVVPLVAVGASPTFNITIKQHGFAPGTLTVPAGVRVKLLVKNARSLPSEFESFDLNREKVVPSGTTVTVWIGPLSPGKYRIFDDFNQGTTGHVVVAREDAK